MEIINLFIDIIKDGINLVIGNDYIYFSANHEDLAKKSPKKLHIYFYLNTIVRTLFITGLGAVFFTNPVTIGLLGLGILFSIKQTYKLIKCIKIDKAFESIITGLDRYEEILSKEETEENKAKQQKYIIGNKVYTKDEIDKIEPKIQNDIITDSHTKKLR